MPSVSVDCGQIHYICEGSGKDIVVLPGFWTNSGWMKRWLELKDIGRVWIIDPPYSNLSNCKTRPNIKSYAKTIVSVFKALGITKPVVIGESLGSATALAVEQICELSGLILVSPASRLIFSRLIEGISLMMLPFSKVSRQRAERMHRRKPELIEPAFQMMSKFRKSELIKTLLALRGFNSYESRPRCKTLLIGGRYDKIATPEIVEKLGKLYNAKTLINEKTGHHVCDHAWPDVSSVAREFIKS